jgi:hypothetical protein
MASSGAGADAFAGRVAGPERDDFDWSSAGLADHEQDGQGRDGDRE